MKKIPCDPQIGADIEVFVYNRDNGLVVPCVGLIDGTKDKPFEPKDVTKGFALQEDNVMLEYNIPPAQTTRTWMGRFDVARQMIKDNLPKELSYIIKPEHKFLSKELVSPQAQTIGCEPDFNAYEGGEMRTFAGILGRHRSCGGHIHLGGDFNCPDFVAALFAELCIGVQGRAGPNKANTRTEWYGRPGIYRPKPYGIEYRTPDNKWTDVNDTIHGVGSAALRLSTWLTTNEAAVIRKAFRAVQWTRVRDYMVPPTKIARGDHVARDRLRTAIINEAVGAGVPL